jgi:hypothetical protein
VSTKEFPGARFIKKWLNFRSNKSASPSSPLLTPSKPTIIYELQLLETCCPRNFICLLIIRWQIEKEPRHLAREISSKSVQVAEELLKPVTIILIMSLLIHGIYHWQEWAGRITIISMHVGFASSAPLSSIYSVQIPIHEQESQSRKEQTELQ